MDDPNKILEFFEKRGKDVAKMPGTFWGGVVIAGVLGFSGGMWYRAQEVVNANGLVTIKDATIASLQKQIDDNSKIVDQAREAWGTLTQGQLDLLQESLSGAAEKSPVSWYSTTATSKAWPEVVATFESSGWNIEKEAAPVAAPAGVTVLKAQADALTIIKNAFDQADIPYTTPDGDGDGADEIWVKPPL